MTDTQAAPEPTESWDSVAATLADRFPGQKPGILFCVWKLQQNPEASLRDFRDEARMRGLALAGRSLHSAKVLLGLAEPSKRRPIGAGGKAAPKPAAAARTKSPGTGEAAIEDSLMAAVRRMQTDAGAEAERLRRAMREAIAVLERALDA